VSESAAKIDLVSEQPASRHGSTRSGAVAQRHHRFAARVPKKSNVWLLFGTIDPADTIPHTVPSRARYAGGKSPRAAATPLLELPHSSHDHDNIRLCRHCEPAEMHTACQATEFASIPAVGAPLSRSARRGACAIEPKAGHSNLMFPQ
jgi:hypothetical protein